MDTSQTQFVEHLKEATNVLVTTSRNPSVDQLAAVIGFTLLLNKIDKHATAVFSGEVPPAINFLEPEKTLEPNTDSLRDFIIAIDKSKADKLRYKVEDSHVKIFITPYRTSISDKDLEFSQGDFNVDLVVLLGVHDQKDLDQAIVAHGRILHDATVVSVSNTPGNNLGSVNWVLPKASSLSEMLVAAGEAVKPGAMDSQIATALMTGIVAETERFSNTKTSANTMAISAKLMAAGANQQLVATELQPKPEPVPVPQPVAPAPPPPAAKASPDGSLAIDHSHDPEATEADKPAEEDKDADAPQIHIDENGGLYPIAEMEDPKPKPGNEVAGLNPDTHKTAVPDTPSLMTSPPILGGTLTANITAGEEGGDKSTDPLSQSPLSARKILSHDDPVGSDAPSYLPTPTEPTESTPQASESADHQTEHGHLTIQPPKHDNDPPTTDLAALLSQSENTTQPVSSLPELPVPAPIQPDPLTVPVDAPLPQVSDMAGLNDMPASADVTPPPALTADSARDAVTAAMNADSSVPLSPPAAFNAQQLDVDVQSHPDEVVPAETPTVELASPPPDLPPGLISPVAPAIDTTASPIDTPTSPPDLPPPMMPPLPGFVQPPSEPPKQ